MKNWTRGIKNCLQRKNNHRFFLSATHFRWIAHSNLLWTGCIMTICYILLPNEFHVVFFGEQTWVFYTTTKIIRKRTYDTIFSVCINYIQQSAGSSTSGRVSVSGMVPASHHCMHILFKWNTYFKQAPFSFLFY